jgi:ferredoxin-NADP reductase
MQILRSAVAAYAALGSRTPSSEITAVNRDLALVVTSTDPLATDVRGLTLAAPDGGELPEWTPGAHLDLILPSGRLRQYSLVGDPGDRTTYQIAVRHLEHGSGGSLEVHELSRGTPVMARGPRNAFPFAYPHLAKRDIEKVAFIAGGIGITALLPMVHAAAASRVPWSLTYVGRDTGSMPFLGELDDLGGDVRILHGAPSIDRVLTGVDARTSVYFCGPPPFLDALRAELAQHPHAGFHFERFAPPPVIGGTPFTVRLRRSGTDIEVPADTSALAAIREAKPDVPYSCQQGFCGTCRVDVVAGSVTKRGTSAFLERPGTMLICVDRTDEKTITVDL